MTADAQPPVRPALPCAFPLAEGDGAVVVAWVLHRDAPVVGCHIDLFVGAPSSAPRPDERIARTFRLPLEAWSAGAPSMGTYDAVELEAHRAEYLALGSPRELANARGRVEPLLRASGHGTVRADAIEVRCSEWRAHFERSGPTCWRITLAQP
jgi:hypothetical protein